jgi:hypothetical protein
MTRKSETFRRGMLAACAVIVVVAAAGCTRGMPATHPSGSWVTSAEANKEYRHAAASLVLAQGMHWPADPETSKGPDGAPQYYQVGAATNDAQFYWFCSWTTKAVVVDSEAFDAQAATALRRVSDLRLGGSGSDENTKQLLDEVRTALEEHDTAAVRIFDAKNCVGTT